jgi:iron complex outermembrane receptor protein
MKLTPLTLAILGTPALVISPAVQAQKSLGTVEIREYQQDLSPNLTKTADAASRLDLSIKETPASIEVITQQQIEQRGARTFEEALRGGVGMQAGGNPGSPSVSSTRGFTGGFVTYLFDGSRISTSSMSSRPQDTWNYERIEILKGPASVLYGEGAIGGVVNFVTKRPDRNNPSKEAMVSYGSFNTMRAGLGLGTAVGENSALRIDYSHQETDGYIERNKQSFDNLTLGYTSKLTRDLKLDLTVDYINDKALSYWGSPLVPANVAKDPSNVVTDSTGRVIDRALAFKNYNVNDAVMKNESVWSRAKLQWEVAPQWSVRNELSYFTANRRWRNSESYSFVAPNLLNRDLVDIGHDHQVLGNRIDLANTSPLGGMRNRFVVGMEFTQTNFATERRFSDGSAGTNTALRVDLSNPIYSNFSDNPSFFTGAGNRTNFKTNIPTFSIFAEDALSLTDQLTLIGGVRNDKVTVERSIYDLNTGATSSFSQSYNPNSWRLGTVFAFDKDTSVYAQYTNAAAPVGTSNLLLLSAANSAFELSKGEQTEIGIKQSLFGGKLDYTLAVYQIKLNNILTRDSTTPAITVNSGAQSSKGIELSAAWRATKQLSVSGNLALVTAQYDDLTEAGGVSRVGNRPPNVSNRVSNLWADYQMQGTPLKLGASLNQVDDFYTNTANTVRINGYRTMDVYASWNVKPGSLTFRIRNITDELYATWSGASAANQVMIGAPRSAELSYRIAF